jgi:hypothetical protein
LIVASSREGNGNEDDDGLEYDGDDGDSPFVHDGDGIESEEDALAAYDLFAEGELGEMDKHAEECVMDYDGMSEVLDQEPREDATADQIFNLENLEGRIQELIKEWEEVNHQLDHIDMTTQIVKRVLGDAFHFMDRIKVPTHHEYKAAYLRTLRSAFFICDEHDLDLVKAVARGNGQKWEHVMAFFLKK